MAYYIRRAGNFVRLAGTRAKVVGAILVLSMLPGGCDALEVLVNQVGFEPNAPKVFRVQRATDSVANGTFSVRRVSDGTGVYSGSLTRKGPLWDKYYWEGDFSAFQTPGEYYITATIDSETGTSYDFSIAPDIYIDQTGVLTYQYFWTQRCGVAVPGWHGVCHADDGLRKDNNQHWDAAGGWHDAGDYNKFPHGFAGDGVFCLLWLYEANRAYYDAIDTDANGLADIVDEALHQARWLAKMVEPSGHCLKETQKRRIGPSWVRPESDTNNIIGDWDDRWINPGDELTPQEIVVCGALIRMHRMLKSKGLPTENFKDKALAIWNHRVALAVAEGGHNNLGNSAYQVFAGLDLYAETGQQDCWDRALQRVSEMASTAISNPAFYDSINYAEGPGYDLGALAWFARNYPNTYPASAARQAVQSLMARYMYLADDPIGLIRRDDGGTLEYFQTNPDWNGYFIGINRLYLLLTWGALQAYQTIGDQSYLRFAMDQYNWVMGANYNQVCMMEGAGDYNLPKYHTRYDTIPGHSDGAQPGVVPNGYVRVYSTGLPHIDLTGNRWQSNEGWLINNAAYAMAISEMHIFRDSAQVVSNTIPSTMVAGRTYTVSITMKNTGSATWDSDHYRLGGVDDSDPFAAARQYIATGMTVPPGGQYTFTFIMTAPVTPGTYTTDWRMVRESVRWFGETLTRTVQVVGTRVQISNSTFNSGLDGWQPSVWRAYSGYSYGHIDWANSVGVGSSGGVRASGDGASDNSDRCTREGGEIQKIISTAGYQDIKFSYDLRVGPLGASNAGVGVGSCAVDHNLIDEQITIFYSTDGGATWQEAEWLKRSDLLAGYQLYGRRNIDLSAVSAANNNPNFALRFRWQFNNRLEGGDYGDLDNIIVTGIRTGKVRDARTTSDGTVVSLKNKVLYLKRGAFGYIQEPDRSGGIRIEGNISASEGQRVDVIGVMRTTPGGERYISVDSISSADSAAVRPLGMNNRSLCNRMVDGIYITAWGKVKAGSITGNSFVITDGSDDAGVRVMTPGQPGVAEGQFVTVTGAAGFDGERIIYQK